MTAPDSIEARLLAPDALETFIRDARLWLDTRNENAKPGWMVAQIDKAADALAQRDKTIAELRESLAKSSDAWGDARAHLADARAEVERLTKEAETQSTERFLSAYVSQDSKVVGIEHDTDADWHQILAAHVALRDRLNVRLAEMDKCPFKPRKDRP